MAERTVLVSDLSGVEGDVTQVIYSFEGKDWEIDLTKEERATLAELLEPYIKVSRKPKRKGSTEEKRSNADTAKVPGRVIADYFKANPDALPKGTTWLPGETRGRVPSEVREAYARAMAKG